MSPRLESIAERLYTTIYDEDDGRVCHDISEEACRVVPGNFLLNTLAQGATKLGDALINPKTTLPWLLTALQAPGWIAAMLVPIRESGSMLPQLAIAAWVRRLPVRKWCCSGAAIAQALVAAALALLTLLAARAGDGAGTWAGLMVLGLVILFSLARGFASIATKDVLGKTVPKTRRGQVGGLATSAAGLGTLGCAAWLAWWGEGGNLPYAGLFAFAALSWLLAAWGYGAVVEAPGATAGAVNGLREAFARITVLRDDAAFRRFVLSRALLMGSGLAAPFLVVMAQRSAATGLAWFIVAQGLAALISGPLWGLLADRSSRRLLLGCGVAAGLLGCAVFVLDLLAPALIGTRWFLPGAFFLLAMIHEGVRLARKTYVVDLAGGNRRTDYVAVSNTVIGVLLLLVGAVTALLAQLSTASAVLALSVGAFAAAWLTRGLPEVQS